jgi:hypothetical protein
VRVALVLALTVTVLALMPAGSEAAPSLSPGLFEKVASGVALIRTYGCGGRPIALGSGFLVGDSVVMTARHVVSGACRVTVRVDGGTYRGTRWVSWYAAHTSVAAADVATIKLNRPAAGAYVFRVRSSLPPLGSNLSAVGYPLGNRLSLNQGKLIARLRVCGAPLIAVKMLGAEGGSGSAFVDDEGRAVGILQLGFGSKDLLGQRTSGVLVGLDLVRWWGPRARLDLCRAYPHGGIAGCPGAKPAHVPPPPAPSPTPPPPPAPVTPHIQQCWAQYTGGSTTNWNPADATSTFSSADILTRGASNFEEIASLDPVPSEDLDGVITLTLTEPNGQVFATTTFAAWTAGTQLGGFDLSWTWEDGSLFFQHPEVSGQGVWTFTWKGPDGLTCANQITVS